MSSVAPMPRMNRATPAARRGGGPNRARTTPVKLAPIAFQPTGLTIALTVSVAMHLVLLVIRFAMPHAALFKPEQSPLEVILVNAKTQDRAVKPDAIAQADLNGGGENETGRATSFLPRSRQALDGDVLKESQSAQEQQNTERRRLMARVDDAKSAVAAEAPPKAETTEAAPTTDLLTSMKAIARLEAQVDRETRDYNARPRRGYIGPTTKAASYAMYYAQWKDKVERIGTINYPEEARGRIYGDLVLRVTLNPDGTIHNDEVTITKSSGSPVLDRAAKRIVRLGAPYGRFSDELRSEFDIFEIYSTFRFTRGNALEMRTVGR